MRYARVTEGVNAVLTSFFALRVASACYSGAREALKTCRSHLAVIRKTLVNHLTNLRVKLFVGLASLDVNVGAHCLGVGSLDWMRG